MSPMASAEVRVDPDVFADALVLQPVRPLPRQLFLRRRFSDIVALEQPSWVSLVVIALSRSAGCVGLRSLAEAKSNPAVTMVIGLPSTKVNANPRECEKLP